MVKLTSEFSHQDVLSICSVGNELIAAAIGGSIYCYSACSGLLPDLKWSQVIFHGQKIHLLKSGRGEEELIVVGGKNVAVCRFVCPSKLDVIFDVRCSDWILDAEVLGPDEVILLTAHNQVQLWSVSEKRQERVSSSSERCILYSGKFYKTDDKLFVLAGTVYSQVVIWKPDLEQYDVAPPVMYRLEGHKGVVFSIAVGQSENYPVTIATTSDDRSILLRIGFCFEDGTTMLERPPFFGHTARVWKSLLLPDCIATIGEDSLLCVWALNGVLLSKTLLHQGGGIRSLAWRDGSFVIGGSDGGISEISGSPLLVTPKNSALVTLVEGVIPRKVAFLYCWGLAILTNNGLFCRVSDDSPLLKAPLEGTNQYGKCTDLAVSKFGRYIGVTTVCGQVLIVDTMLLTSPEALPEGCSYNIGDGKRCESLSWRGDFLLVEIEGGVAKLFLFDPKKTPLISLIATFIIPKFKQRCFTCFLRLPEEVGSNRTLVGDRMGNLHVYEDSQEAPLQTLRGLHSFLGLSDVVYRGSSRTVLTVGAGGWLRELAFTEGRLSLLRSARVPMESAVKILCSFHETVVAGFEGAYLKLWNFNTRMTIASFKCGGGHRSFDFVIDESSVEFVYIKDKKVYQVPFLLNFGSTIRYGYHTKVINCFEVLDMSCNPIAVSGGDDNTVRVVELRKENVVPISVLEQHISSVRAVCVHPITDRRRLIIAAGGREQITVTEFDLVTRDCREILSHFQSTSPAEGRYMCLETVQLADGRVLLLAGCSDCILRIFIYRMTLELATLELVGCLRYTHCILQVTTIDGYVVSFGSDGKAVFWEVKGMGVDEKELSLPTAPTAEFALHQSGINSFLVWRRAPDEWLLATGGDDNMLSLAVFRLDKGNSSHWEIVSRWTTSESHSSQITGLVRHDEWLISTSVDQRVVVHSVREEDREVRAEIVADLTATVPDAHGLALLSAAQSLSVCVYGKGIEVISIDLNS